MRLALQTDYSLRTLMFLAARPGRQTVAGVAGFFQISETHVGKVVHQLARLGYVRSIRGIGGGLELARPADQITIGEVVQAIEGNVHLLECIGMEDVCVIQRHCKLRTVLDRAERIQLEYLNSVRLTDVLPFGQPLLNLPGAVARNHVGETAPAPEKPKRSPTKRKKPGSKAGE
ncbi:MAG: Rrf2 family transcriptional regulator [Planctomycetes bacterium]|nr:Rrf2 family transcriptional regulator [Planctomycetota bacterium]